MKERADLATRDWLSMRDEIWRVDDFLAKWSKSTDGGAKDAVAMILLKETDMYRYSIV